MKSLLEQLRQKNPSLSLEDARRAMGLPGDAGFNFMGESVPTKEDASTVPFEQNIPVDDGQIPPSLNPLAVPSALANPQDVVAANSPEPKAIHLSFPEEPIIVQKPQIPVSKPKPAPVAAPQAPEQGKSLEEISKDMPTDFSRPAPQTAAAAGPTSSELFRQAQQRDNEAQDIADWLKIGNQIGGGFAMQSSEDIAQRNKIADAIGASGQRNVKQLTQQIEFEKQDPSSSYSKKARQFLKDKFNIDLPEDISVAQLDATFMGPALKSFEATEKRKAEALQHTLDFQNKQLLQKERLEAEAKSRQDNIRLQAQLLEPFRLEKLQADREKLDEKREEKRKLSNDQTKSINELDTLLDNLKKLEVEKKVGEDGGTPIDTGRISAGLNTVAGFVGLDDPKITAFRASLGQNLADYIRSISGATVTPQEREFLTINTPNFKDNDEQFNRKMTAFINKVADIRKRHISGYKNQGKNVSNFEQRKELDELDQPKEDSLADKQEHLNLINKTKESNDPRLESLLKVRK